MSDRTVSDRTGSDRVEPAAAVPAGGGSERVVPPAAVPGRSGATGRADLEARYRTLVRSLLPAAAREQGWVLRHDHCFGRVLLDDAVGGCWYDVLDRRRTAFSQLDDAQLAGAVALAERLLEQGDPLLRELDARSLAWRGKPPKRTGRRS